MKVLVINCGSSSLKFQLIQSDTEEVLAKGLCERIGISQSRMVYKKEGTEHVVQEVIPSHRKAVQMMLDVLCDSKDGVITALSQIDAIGHRLVHGGKRFAGSAVITKEVEDAVRACIPFAPLHNPVNLTGVKVCKEFMPNTPMVGVFDTAFHQTMPEKAYLYGIPYEYYEQDEVRRYGFHGISHSYVSGQAAKVMGEALEKLKLIVCHLGNGASVTAVNHGKSIDTSMGFSPLEGLIMGTRSGDVDPAILEYLSKTRNKDIASLMQMLNSSSGVLGLSGGISSDFRDLRKAAAEGNEAAKRAIQAFVYRVLKYIGSYTAVMNGVDGIIFTGGVGENSADIRAQICENLTYLGVIMDEKVNRETNSDGYISCPDSKIKLLVISTDEELEICRETVSLLK